MLRDDEKDQSSGETRKKTYSRSMTWTERTPRKSNSKSPWNSKARACLPPLQPLSIARPSPNEWPRAGSDDLGMWLNPPTPLASSGSVTPRENPTSDAREFHFRRDMLSFYSKECSRILDHVYLGSDAVAKNREILRENGITHVLNCVGFVCPEYFKNELVYKTLWLQDSPSEDITSIMYDVFDYFEEVREQRGRVLVHCCQGVSRSTSLVIAYLMWKEGQTFEDAFQLVKSARGITNPNVGFACQLLQCQKRVHALPPSPSSIIRMYRMSPHSPYDPLHLVPKMVLDPSGDKLDSRGAFIVHVPSSLYVWIGKNCALMMLDDAVAAASQIICYERAKGPVVTVNEGKESLEFWDAVGCIDSSSNQRKVGDYDMDFGIFHEALTGGVVPRFPLSEAEESETCLPVMENGWNRLRKNFAEGVVKEFIKASSSKLKPISALNAKDGLEVMDTTCIAQVACGDSSASNSVQSEAVTESNSPSLSPSSTSDYSSSFYSSPSSSDSSFVSAYPSPRGVEESVSTSADKDRTLSEDDATFNSLDSGGYHPLMKQCLS